MVCLLKTCLVSLEVCWGKVRSLEKAKGATNQRDTHSSNSAHPSCHCSTGHSSQVADSPLPGPRESLLDITAPLMKLFCEIPAIARRTFFLFGFVILLVLIRENLDDETEQGERERMRKQGEDSENGR